MLINNNELQIGSGEFLIDNFSIYAAYESAILDNQINICFLENNIEVYTEDGAAKQSKIKELIKKVIEFLKSIPQRLRKLIDAIKKKISKMPDFLEMKKSKILQKLGKAEGSRIVYKGYSYKIDKVLDRLEKILDIVDRISLRGSNHEVIAQTFSTALDNIYNIIGSGDMRYSDYDYYNTSIKNYLIDKQDLSQKDQYFNIDDELMIMNNCKETIEKIDKYNYKWLDFVDEMIDYISKNNVEHPQELVQEMNRSGSIIQNTVSHALGLLNARMSTAGGVIETFIKHAKKEEKEKYDL
jgi:hypothetical protein